MEYIASKTVREDPETIRVLLSDRTKFIIDKYRGVVKDGLLLPFISRQKYDEPIKEIFEAAENVKDQNLVAPLIFVGIS